MRNNIRMIILIIYILIFILFPFLPIAAGDGMPAVPKYGTENTPENIFSSIFESRQLATVELIDDYNERISLFLSVYSMDPGDNLTILVPLRTLPTNVTGQPIKEKDFRVDYKIAKAEREIIRQDMDVAMEKFGDEFKSYFQYTFGSLVWTYAGEYTRQEIQEVESYDYYGSDSLKEGTSSGEFGEPIPIQHYEFDGFSIDVFNISSGPVLSDYLEEKGLVLPESQVFTKYNNQYVAVIESETKPPISDVKFNILKEYVPDSLATLVYNLKHDPVKDVYEIQALKNDLYRFIYYEYGEIEREVDFYKIVDYIGELIDAVFGHANFEGEVLEIDLPLDNGKMFFPLGTSGGWPNNIGDIDILFKVPENKAIEIPNSQEAYFDDAHWYLFQQKNSNPDYDLESSLSSSDSTKKNEMEQAEFITDHYKKLAFVVSLVILIVLWFSLATVARIATDQKEKKVIRDPRQWLFLGLAFVISIPGALLLYLLLKPIPLKELKQNLIICASLIFYPVSVLLLIMGVVL